MSEVYERYGELPRLRDSQRAGQQLLPRRVYRFRVLGMGVAGLPIALVLRENGAAPWSSWYRRAATSIGGCADTVRGRPWSARTAR